ncbi:ParD-like family protein [Diaphorobacter sp.]|uniref:ParD-like family protein n=1 Tax=Diaphorobacter sp. TaxID=1934310 RepID=UPI0028AC0FBC|nr:ParD-like family protein [Diaphorobacter sp.]
MGIVKISDELHDQIRLSSAALHRSINAQAEHWLRVGQLAESHPDLDYSGICALLHVQARGAGTVDRAHGAASSQLMGGRG